MAMFLGQNTMAPGPLGQRMQQPMGGMSPQTMGMRTASYGDSGMFGQQMPQQGMQTAHYGDNGMFGGQMAPHMQTASYDQGWQGMQRPQTMAPQQGYSNPMIGNALRGLGQPMHYASRAGRMRNAARHAALGGAGY